MSFPDKEPPLSTSDETTIEQRERRLNRELALLQVCFADKKYKATPEPKSSFFEMLSALTPLMSSFGRIANQELGKSLTQEELSERWQIVHDLIERIYQDKPERWEELICRAVEEAKKALRAPGQPGRSRGQPEERIGMFARETKRMDGLESYRIAPTDELLEVHVQDFFKTDQGSLNMESIRRSFGKLAEYIVDRQPTVKVVIGKSWLLSHPIARRLGFHIVDEITLPQNGMDAWRQFVDKDGHLNAHRAEELMQKGELPMKSSFGFIFVEDLLRRYLPESRRGEEIVLQEIDPAWEEERQAQKQEEDALQVIWPSLRVEKIDEELSSYPHLSQLFERLGNRREWVNLLKTAKQRGLTWDELEKIEEHAELRRLVKQDQETQKQRMTKLRRIDLSV